MTSSPARLSSSMLSANLTRDNQKCLGPLPATALMASNTSLHLPPITIISTSDTASTTKGNAPDPSQPENPSVPLRIRTANLTFVPSSSALTEHQPLQKLPWTTSKAIRFKAFWKWFLTIPGLIITLYDLNVVAWGGMLFLLLCNASPAMCHPPNPSRDPCNDIDSPRRIWIEIDSQILNALFCITGFGLMPWRGRDLWWWNVWRLGFGKKAWGRTRQERQSYGIRRLAGIHCNWFRLQSTDNPPLSPSFQERDLGDFGSAIPIPASKTPDPPATGMRAPQTSRWKMDLIVWCNIMNTAFQACLCGFMWGMDRYNRPSWSTGLFVALACGFAGCGGILIYLEKRKIKMIEGTS